MRYYTAVVTYAFSCALLHHLLQLHYINACQSSFFAVFFIESSPYCEIVKRSLLALQWSPLIVVGAIGPSSLPFLPREGTAHA
jgi:hypothetical protein